MRIEKSVNGKYWSFDTTFCSGESFTRLPETNRVLFFAFKMSDDMAEIDALLRMVFYSFEKIRRYRLSREGKLKVCGFHFLSKDVLFVPFRQI